MNKQFINRQKQIKKQIDIKITELHNHTILADAAIHRIQCEYDNGEHGYELRYALRLKDLIICQGIDTEHTGWTIANRHNSAIYLSGYPTLNEAVEDAVVLQSQNYYCLTRSLCSEMFDCTDYNDMIIEVKAIHAARTQQYTWQPDKQAA